QKSTALWLIIYEKTEAHLVLYVMSAPNLLRIGTEERIFIEIQDNVNRNQNVNVEIRVMNHPTKATTFTSTSVTLTDQANFQAFAKIVIPPETFANDRNGKHYVTLQAQFPDQLLEKVALVSFQSGFIFIQTDKPIYTPSSSVRYRIFAMWPDMQSQSDTSVNFEIVSYLLLFVVLVCSFGNWKMVANFHSNAAESFTTEFEVKEYVLPSFEVKLLLPPTTPFFYVDSNALDITIKATYTFGREVDGTAYVVFGCINGDEKKSFPSSLQRVPIQNGNGMVTLLKKHITEIHKNILDLVGKSIYVSVSVLTESGSEMVEAELKGIKIVQSPYTIHFKRTPKHFKPGLSFDVTVEVLNPDGSPAEGIPVSVNPGGVLATTKSNGMARLPINPGGEIQSLRITARTNYPPYAPNRQATATMVALPYKSPSNSLLHLSVHTAEVELGEQMKLDLYFTKPESQEKHITYLILSRGQLVKHFREKNVNLNQMSVNVDITKEMLPSFRVVAYYHTSSNELVSDSVWVDVTDTCMGKLTLEMKTPAASYEPRKTINVLVTGDPGATVGMVAVDDAVYILNNKNRLTQKKIWDVVEQYDTGCTAGGGKDGRNVFYDAGLLFQSSHDGSPSRTDLKCPTATRRKRETTILEVRTSLISGFRTHLQKDCCLDGMKEIPVSYTCERRTEYIVDGPECKQAFLHCCNEMKKQRDERKVEILHLARSETDDYKVSNDEIVSRSNFPESWFWKDISLRCPANDPNCNTVTAQKTEALPDTITTWQLTAVSMSKTHGLCVAKPLKIITWKPFFIDLRLPYSAVQGEQLEIRAILHNYDDNPITVRIELKEEASICSAAYKKKWFRSEVQVGRQTTRAVPFIIIPMKHGSFPIEVKAAVKGSFHSDGVRKMLLVVLFLVLGIFVHMVPDVLLFPITGGRQEEIINSDIPMAHLVPNTPESTLISLTGIGQMNTLLDNVISGESMGSLIRAPSGCGEQNMKDVTLPVIAALYLDKTNQWEHVGFEKRNEAIQHIKTGYETQLKFRKDDGSFAMYSFKPSTTWLTAYVAKVFPMATAYVHIDTSVVCGAIKFLILQTQRPDGMFVEVGEVSDKRGCGRCRFRCLHDCFLPDCHEGVDNVFAQKSLSSSMRKAQAYLERRLQSLTNPYAVALTSYALVNFKKLDRGFSTDQTHWPVQKGKDATLEATAYALLALVKDQAFEEAKPIVRWLSQQQRYGGDYGATQATIMVYQAVAEYASNVNEPPFDLNVDVSVKGRSLMNKINLNNQNHYSTRTSKFEGINKDVTVTATGTGEAMFNMVSLYYAIPTKRESDCEMFDLTVELIEENKRVYKLKIEVLYKNTERNASMSILDIGLPTGYKFNKNDLDALSTGRDRIIDEYEANKELSEKGSLIIYLNKVSHTRPEEISFRIEQSMAVEFLQPAAVSVYEYYDKKRCVKFYRPQRKSGELLRLCQSEACLCAEENCSKQRKEKISNDNRLEKACESTESSKIDFVYKVVVVDFFDNYTTDSYNVRILQTFKNGTTDESPLDQYRTFLTYQHCREALDLRPGKTYLIMGTSADIHIVGTSFRYIIGETTWVEYWPTPEECQTDIHRPVCMDLELMEDQLVDFGCIMKK
uniref:Anaphylatoxin-like domain-containing protein n=1 Tax=Poecilia mexicana TaxID=48701 RepID=A0A3B3WJD3_9TELE